MDHDVKVFQTDTQSGILLLERHDEQSRKTKSADEFALLRLDCN